MKRIIVPIDFSEDALNALEYAIEMANNLQANIRMLFVKKSEKFEMPIYSHEYDNKVEYTAQGYFEKLIEKYASSYKVKNGVFDYKIRQGVVYKEIVNQAKYNDAYCIVMGAHGASGFEEFFVGSNAFKVVSNANCPVITLRSMFKAKKIENILMPIDSSKETRNKIALVVEIAKLHRAKIHILGVYESEQRSIVEKVERYVNLTEKYIKEQGLEACATIIKGENNTDTTLAYTEYNNIDVIAIMREQVESMFSILFSSYAQQMVNKSTVPVMSVPN